MSTRIENFQPSLVSCSGWASEASSTGLSCIKCFSGITCTSAGYPADSVQNLEVNMLWDGLFHSTTYIFVLLGLIILWRTAHRTHVRWSSKLLWGTMLIGFGLFNLVEGIIDHHLLGIHHVNETVLQDRWVYWDLGFLVWGALMLIGGWRLMRAGQQETPEPRTGDRADAPIR
jgi:uncharacterized membrane protein